MNFRIKWLNRNNLYDRDKLPGQILFPGVVIRRWRGLSLLMILHADSELLPEQRERMLHRSAGNTHDAREWGRQFKQQKDCPRNRERADD